jgi:alanyl-tRNA synthetase
MTRVEFVCGGRALADYRLTNNTAVAVARLFSCERDSSHELAARALQENRDLKKQVRELRELAMSAEAAELLAASAPSDGFKVVKVVFQPRDFNEVRVLASKIVQREPAIALLATIDAKGARLVFARSTSLTQDMGRLLAQACAALGGRGGGKPDLAQGGGPAVENLEETLTRSAKDIMA